MGSGGISRTTFSVAHRQPVISSRQSAGLDISDSRFQIGDRQSPKLKISHSRFQIGDFRFNPDSEVREFKMELSCLLTTNYIVKIQLRRGWICAMGLIENKPVSPEFRQT
jgi:hypothetical protein